MKNKLIGYILLFLASTIWGTMYVVSKYVMNFVSPITLMWLRYLISFIVLFIFLKISSCKRGNKENINKKDIVMIGWIGFVGYFISIFFQFTGTKFSNAHMGALITATTPVFVVIFARYILKEEITKKKIISLIMAFAGVAVVVGFDKGANSSVLGDMLLIIAAATWAILCVFVKIQSRRNSSLVITTYAMLFALIFTTPFMLFQKESINVIFQSRLILCGVIYLGLVGTAGAFLMWNKGIEMVDTGVGSLFLFFQPAAGGILGWLCLGEKLTASFFVGGILIVIGILISNK